LLQLKTALRLRLVCKAWNASVLTLVTDVAIALQTRNYYDLRFCTSFSARVIDSCLNTNFLIRRGSKKTCLRTKLYVLLYCKIAGIKYKTDEPKPLSFCTFDFHPKGSPKAFAVLSGNAITDPQSFIRSVDNRGILDLLPNAQKNCETNSLRYISYNQLNGDQRVSL
jgi:hypothetical protein